MWPLVRQARYLGRYREIAQVLVGHGFGALVEQLGLVSLLSLPRRVVLRIPPTPPLGTAVRLREALIALGPTFIKLGQLLSTRPDMLPPDVVAELSKLQDTVPPFPAEQAIALIERELGRPIAELFASFDMEPLAAASLGQVHPAVLTSGEQVAVKVQRPDIAARINTDLAIIADLAALAVERVPAAQDYNLVDLAWEFSTTLRAELDYRREGANAERFRRNFAESTTSYVPRIYWELTSDRVLTSERLCGVKVNDLAALAEAGLDRTRLARNSMELILQEIFRDGFFHGDPHPGNFFALPGEVLGVVDFGQVGQLDRSTTRGLLLLLMTVSSHDNAGTLRALEELRLIDRRQISPTMERDLRRFTEGIVDRPLNDLSARDTVDHLIALLRRHRIRLPGELALLFKAIVMMEGTGLQLDPALDVFAIARPYAQQAIAEQFSPTEISNRTLGEGRALAATTLELPHQIGDLLHLLNRGELHIRTEERELPRLAGAIIGAANRLALAFVLAALIVMVGMVAIAMGIGGWAGLLPTVLLTSGLIGAVLLSALLVLALLRGRE